MTSSTRILLFILTLIVTTAPAKSQENLWQHTTSVERLPGRTGKPRSPSIAHLWIPPGCEYVRGSIIGQKTLLEKKLTADPVIRKTAADEDLAIIYLEPGFDALFNYAERGSAQKLQKILTDLAAACEHAELEFAPMLTIGHSTGGIFARNIAYWKPDRVIGIIHIKSGNLHQHIYGKNKSLAGVPFLAVNGQFEEYGPEGGIRPEYGRETQWIMLTRQLLARRRKDPNNLMGMLVHPGGDHTSWDDDLTKYCAMFIRKAVELRVPKTRPQAGKAVKCLPVSCKSGWLCDPDLKDPAHKPVPYSKYAGDTLNALWYLDKKLAVSAFEYHKNLLDKEPE